MYKKKYGRGVKKDEGGIILRMNKWVCLKFFCVSIMEILTFTFAMSTLIHYKYTHLILYRKI